MVDIFRFYNIVSTIKRIKGKNQKKITKKVRQVMLEKGKQNLVYTFVPDCSQYLFQGFSF